MCPKYTFPWVLISHMLLSGKSDRQSCRGIPSWSCKGMLALLASDPRQNILEHSPYHLADSPWSCGFSYVFFLLCRPSCPVWTLPVVCASRIYRPAKVNHRNLGHQGNTGYYVRDTHPDCRLAAREGWLRELEPASISPFKASVSVCWGQSNSMSCVGVGGGSLSAPLSCEPAQRSSLLQKATSNGPEERGTLCQRISR